MDRKLEDVFDKMMALEEDVNDNSGVKIYCNTWGNYNTNGGDGTAVGGGWKDLDDAVEWWNEISKMGEEPFINDFEDYIDLPFEIGEGDYLPDLAEKINDFSNLSEYDKDIIRCIMEADNCDYDYAKERLDNGDFAYYYATNEEDLARECIESAGGFEAELGDRLEYYVDENAIESDIRDEESDFRYEYAEEKGVDIDDIDEDEFEEAFEEYVKERLDMIMGAPYTYYGDSLENYFDYESYGRDLAMDYTITKYGSIQLH